MRRVAFCCLLVVVILWHWVPVEARVRGICSNCHTMHNSQGNSAVDPGGPNSNLLTTSCVGCHSSTGSSTILDIGGCQVPIVFNTSEPTYPPNGSMSSTLAGGNFYWVQAAGKGDAYGHNVFGISNADATLTNAPGASTSCPSCHSTLATATSGCKGCHVPKHHADDGADVVDAGGGYYRFLGSVMHADYSWLPGEGVKGIEADDWEQNPNSTNHNGYMGTADVYAKQGTGPYIDKFTMAQKCNGCHGIFHHLMNSEQTSMDQVGDFSGAWLRHPSDVVLPNSGEYANYTVYDPMVPVAKPDLTGKKNDANVVPGTDIVTCISCHRAHGSPYPDMLRWDYTTMITGGGSNSSGCFKCHTTKDD